MNYEELIDNYINNSELFWPTGDRTSTRSIYKIQRSFKNFECSGNKLKILVKKILNKRLKNKFKSLFIFNAGSSGCHYLGSEFNKYKRFYFIKEVYYPELVFKIISNLNDEEADMAIDFINLIHTGSINAINDSTIPVNVLHLTNETEIYIKDLKRCYPKAMYCCLIRNPFDIAISRTFKKMDYRHSVDPNSDDDKYLKIQISNVKKFFEYLENHSWNHIFKYEEIVNSPQKAIEDFLSYSNENIYYEKNSKINNKISVDNHSKSPAIKLSNIQMLMLREGLNEVAIKWGYEAF